MDQKIFPLSIYHKSVHAKRSLYMEIELNKNEEIKNSKE